MTGSSWGVAEMGAAGAVQRLARPLLSALAACRCESEAEAWVVAGSAGALALAAQLLLSLLLRAAGSGKVRSSAGFLAHQLISLVFMVLLFVVGASHWLAGEHGATPAARVNAPNGVSRWLAAVALGELVIWDIPTGTVLVPELRDPLMLAHHVLMALVAGIGAVLLPSEYYLFYFGFVEASSIPLAIVDVFHPKKLEELTKRSQALAKLNELARISFVLLFMVVRAGMFPFVTVARLAPDVMHVLPTTPPGRQWELYVILGSAAALTCLQLYWTTLILRQVAKMFALPQPAKAETKKAA